MYNDIHLIYFRHAFDLLLLYYSKNEREREGAGRLKKAGERVKAEGADRRSRDAGRE